MGYKVNFLDNATVDAAAINDIGYNLPSVAYKTFEDGTPYGVDDLNAISANIINKGVCRGNGMDCAVTLNNGKVLIQSGTAFFDCGAVIKVDTVGISLSYEKGKAQKVYFFYNAAANVAGAKVAESISDGESDYVLLAEISAEGVLTDAREWAHMKNPSLLPNTYREIHIITKGHTAGEILFKEAIGAYKKLFITNTGSYTSHEFLDYEKGYRQHGDLNGTISSDQEITLYTVPGTNRIELISVKYNPTTTVLEVKMLRTENNLEWNILCM